MPGGRPWRVVSLAPLPADVVVSLLASQGMPAGLPGAAPPGGVEVVVPADPTRPATLAALAEAELVLGDWSSRVAMDAGLVAAAPRLAFLQQPSVGVEHVDLDAFAAAGVPVANTAGANAVSVAEWCLGAALAVHRSMLWADAEVRAGRWPQLTLAERGCVELAGRRVGIVGFGAIGTACASRFAAMGCPVSYWSRHRRPAAAEHGATWRELDDLVGSSDVLVVVVALAPGTRGMLGADRLRSLPAGAVVVDAARGGIVDEEALVACLDDATLLGAALDVFGTEPLPASSPLRHDRVLLSPHASGATGQARLAIIGNALANLRRVVAGEPVRDVQNGVDPLVRRRVRPA